MSQQQTNLMSPTSNFVMQPSLQPSGPMSPIEQRQQQFGTAMEQSASAAPAKSLRPPNCTGDQISPPNHQIPNLSSPIVSPSSTSMDLLQFSAPHLQMTPSGILAVPPKMSFGGQQQQQLGSVMARPGMMGPAGQLSMLSSQDAAHLNTQQHLHQLLQLQQQHHEQQSPHVPGFTISKNLKRSQPSIPASGTISELICEIQDFVSQAQLHLHNKRLKQQQHLHQLLELQQQHHEQQSPHVPGFTISKNLKGSQPSIPASGTISQLICEIQDLVSQAQLHLHNKRLKQVRKASEFQRMESDAANMLEAIQLRDSMEQLSPPAASSPCFSPC